MQRSEETTQKILLSAKSQKIKLDEENPEYERVKKVFNDLITVSHRKDLPWEIHLIEEDGFNAFTIGGGKVFVLTGLFRSKGGVQNDDELAAVLSHEIAHITARHTSEKKGKLLIAQLADKKLASDSYEASFTTNQEDEADKYSVIYSALAGYNPYAGAKIWERLDDEYGSYTGSLLFDHPLNDDRAKNLHNYASKAEQYYTKGKTNHKHKTLHLNNAVYQKNSNNELEAGKGGGTLAFINLLANSYIESTNAKTEQFKRQSRKIEQKNEASRYIIYSNLNILPAKSGGYGLFGNVKNVTGKHLLSGIAEIKYWSGSTVIKTESINISNMPPYQSNDIGIKLQNIQYSNVSIQAIYVNFSNQN